MIFLIINWPNFVYLLVESGFLPPPSLLLNFYEAWRLVLNRMDAPDR